MTQSMSGIKVRLYNSVLQDFPEFAQWFHPHPGVKWCYETGQLFNPHTIIHPGSEKRPNEIIHVCLL